MRFSIIIPIYNVSAFLPECLGSVDSQSFSDYEVVCVDDGSTDDSFEIAQGHVDAHEHWQLIHQENQGLGAARNTGLKHASGDYVLFLDSDDRLRPESLRTLAEILSDEDLLCFNGQRFLHETGAYEAADSLTPENYRSGWDYYTGNALKPRDFAFVCVVLRCYRRSYLLEHGLWFKPGIYHEDNLFTPLACYHAGKVKVIPDILYDYRVRASSIMTSRSLKHWQDVVGIANELAAFFVPKDTIDKTTVYQVLTHHYQVAFAQLTPVEDRELLPLVDWKSYRAVSRTKPRHRLLYAALRVSPRLFRAVLKMIG